MKRRQILEGVLNASLQLSWVAAVFTEARPVVEQCSHSLPCSASSVFRHQPKNGERHPAAACKTEHHRVSVPSLFSLPSFAQRAKTPRPRLLLSVLAMAPRHAAGPLQDRCAGDALYLRAVAAAMLLRAPAASQQPFPAGAGIPGGTPAPPWITRGSSGSCTSSGTAGMSGTHAYSWQQQRHLIALGPRAGRGAQALQVTWHST
jgi:hypothetical protein